MADLPLLAAGFSPGSRLVDHRNTRPVAKRFTGIPVTAVASNCHPGSALLSAGPCHAKIRIVLRPLMFVVALCALTALTACNRNPGDHARSSDSYYVDIQQVPVRATAVKTQPGASTGTWQSQCGRNENKHRNADNVVVQPKLPGAAHHTHDYVGNLSTDAFSTDQSLAAAGTTCRLDDRSTYYWPVLRLTDEAGDDADTAGGGIHGNHGRIVLPDSVLIQLRGNSMSNVVAAPRFLRAITGNPVAVSQDGEHAEHVQWTCSGARDRVTNRYPRCADGQQVVRVFDFPKCWDGKATDSTLHRSHLVFPNADVCPIGTFPVPQLHVELAYSIPADADYAIDSFPEEGRDPLTDHAMAIGVMPDSLMSQAVACINAGRHC
ncbi:DUF1996 domain-containing protein [Kibdelosporangium philippinense]|uniref:DUF1996 domain-containing protein n=1 Tax=Kibdelosporangium philippinense TaxID=211113 RepID=A0ABS8ZEW6_9PSEU|nr:DUF1996 domain-containing protein [Kibdelosporangium philippinense]MCE7006351.1 DUF1996 domain-containing protein [Kibdelosporangium philippinense]